MSRGNTLPPEYQDKTVAQHFLGNGVTTIFVADELPALSQELLPAAVQVYVGGSLQTQGYIVTSVDAIIVDFDQAPTAGYQVSIRIRQGQSWYQPGINTASDGVALQETNTLAARFIRGE
jgi:hypothetical protein